LLYSFFKLGTRWVWVVNATPRPLYSQKARCPIRTHTHTHIHTYIHIYIHAYIHTYIRTYIHEELITKHMKSFLIFTKSIDFDQL